MMAPLYEEVKGTGYTGPVRLSAEQKAKTQRRTDAWTRSVIAQARDASDPETQENARTLLRLRGIEFAS